MDADAITGRAGRVAPAGGAAGTTVAAGPWTAPDYGVRLLGALPAAAFVIDAVGTIRFATERAAALVDQHPDGMVGASVLDFVDASTAWAYAAAVAMATDYPTVFMGPLRVTFTSPSGERTADLWAMNRLDDPAIEGIVCLLTDETAAMGLGDAIAALANAGPLDDVLQRVATAMRGQPVAAVAAVAVRDGDGFRVVRAAEPTGRQLPDALLADDLLWREVVETGQRTLAELDDLPGAMRDATRAAGFRAVWVEPVPASGDRAGSAALVLWRARPGAPSPNQLNSLHQAAGIVSVALRLQQSDPT